MKRMRAAVEGWDNNSEQKREAEGDMKRYAALVEIPYKTFQKYACTDKSKRRKLGGSVAKGKSRAREELGIRVRL